MKIDDVVYIPHLDRIVLVIGGYDDCYDVLLDDGRYSTYGYYNKDCLVKIGEL